MDEFLNNVYSRHACMVLLQLLFVFYFTKQYTLHAYVGFYYKRVLYCVCCYLLYHIGKRHGWMYVNTVWAQAGGKLFVHFTFLFPFKSTKLKRRIGGGVKP